MLKKVLSPFKSPSSNLLFASIMTWLYVIVVLMITGPLVTLSEATTPETWITILHIGLMAPSHIYFMLSYNENFPHIKSSKSRILPLMTFSIPAWVILSLLGFGAAILWIAGFLGLFLGGWIYFALSSGLELDKKQKN